MKEIFGKSEKPGKKCHKRPPGFDLMNHRGAYMN